MHLVVALLLKRDEIEQTVMLVSDFRTNRLLAILDET